MNEHVYPRLARELLNFEIGRNHSHTNSSVVPGSLQIYERYIKDIYYISNDAKICIAEIFGPVNTPYEGGTFTVQYKIPDNYPFRPPTIRMITPIYHMNISTPNQNIHISDLLDDSWAPLYTLVIVSAVFSHNSYPNLDLILIFYALPVFIYNR